MASTALVTVVSGAAYVEYGRQMFLSADEFFFPTESVQQIMLDGEEGWPNATMMRYHILSRHLPDTDYIFLIDADMVIAQRIGPEILPLGGKGFTATLHPGYIGKMSHELPHERRPESAAFVPETHRDRYYAGGFVGGSRVSMRTLCADIMGIIDRDAKRGIVPIFHDESALNKVIAGDAKWHGWSPATVLSPAYCHPDRDDYYKMHVWGEAYERKIVALDKTAEERGER